MTDIDTQRMANSRLRFLLITIAVVLVSGIVGILIFPRLSQQGLSVASYQDGACQESTDQEKFLDTEISEKSPAFTSGAANSQPACVEWRGYLEVPLTDRHEFFTESSNGSWVWIDRQLVVDNGGTHALRKASGKIPLNAGFHAIRIRYAAQHETPLFRILWEETGNASVPLRGNLLFPPTLSNHLKYLFLTYRVFFICLLGIILFWLQKDALRHSKQALLLLIQLLILGNLLIFEEYVFGAHCLAFLDWGGDSVMQVFPLISFFTNGHSIGDFWMHESVLGNTVFTFPMVHNRFDPLLHLIFFKASVPEVAERMVYYVMLQSLIAGASLYGFLRRSERTPVVALLGAFCYALCGAFTGSATWWASVWLPNLLAGLALILWTFKVWQQQRRWSLFFLAAAYFVVSTPAIVTLYQLTLFLAIYLIYEFLRSERPFTVTALRMFAQQAGKLALIGGLGILSVGIIFLPHLYYMFFENYRYNSSYSSLYGLSSFKEFLAVWLRLFSNDLAGTANTWTEHFGYSNYFEMPFLYAGLLFVLILPTWYLLSGFHARNRRRAIAVSVLIVPFLLAMVLPGLRSYLFYMGKLHYFRWACVFAIAAVIIGGTDALEQVLTDCSIRRKRTKLRLAAGSLLGLLGGTYAYFFFSGRQILDPVIVLAAAGWLIGYAGLLSLANAKTRQMLLMFAVFVELVWQGHHTVTYQRRPIQKATFSVNGYATSAMYSYPPMMAAFDDVKRREAGQFVRISKTPEAAPEADNSALCYGYYGTRGYTGFNNRFTAAFLFNRKIDLKAPELAAWIPGFRDRYWLDALVGVKYYLKRGTLEVPPWAEPVTRFEDVEVFANPRALPLGVIYHDYLWQTEFDALTLDEPVKDTIFMSTAVLSDIPDTRTLLQAHNVPYMTTPIPALTEEAQVLAAIRDRQATAMTLTAFENDVMTGTIQTDRPGILFFSIPFDPGWQIFIDGKEVQKIPVNIGFLGVVIPVGEHSVKLVYLPKTYRIGKILSMCTLLVLGLSMTVFRRQSQEWLCVR